MLKELNLGSQSVKHAPSNEIHLHFYALLQKNRKSSTLIIKINRSMDIYYREMKVVYKYTHFLRFLYLH
jgi:hypothetical protein